MLLALAAGVYAGVIFGPAYLQHFDVREAVAVAANQAATKDDDTLKAMIVARLNRAPLGPHWEVDRRGVEHELPGLGISESDIQITRRTDPPEDIVEVHYRRKVQLRPTDRWHEWTLSARAQGAH